jgi:hypothetical protein
LRKTTLTNVRIAKVIAWVDGVANQDYSGSGAEIVENVLMS